MTEPSAKEYARGRILHDLRMIAIQCAHALKVNPDGVGITYRRERLRFIRAVIKAAEAEARKP